MEPLDFDELKEEMVGNFPPEMSHRLESLIHTYVGGPVTTLYTQLEIIKRALERKPEMVAGEVESMQENVELASANIRTLVKALAAAANAGDEEENTETGSGEMFDEGDE
jgi:hypothetical protein